MTIEQLAIFIAVAERQHLTQGAAAVGLTPSAASAAIKALEAVHAVRLFDRVGRRIELTRDGMAFLEEARQTLARVRQAEQALNDLGGLKRGTLDVMASQTVANYWLPARLLAFASSYPGITVNFSAANTNDVAEAVISGAAELGIVEGHVDVPVLATRPIGRDRLVAVSVPSVALARPRFSDYRWIMREPGSGTRAEFEAGVAKLGVDPATLDVALALPTNEAVLNAVLNSDCAAALSEMVVAPFVAAGRLSILPFELPQRNFSLLYHRERRPSAAVKAFRDLCLEGS
ncbi:LysR family transcriptional regulator [Devosia sp.]|uniref:LysR family transcriptional regulator n=1 Tax=Devosia sp. TaxID=1871048 RepID=UPI0025E03B6C|nr:LysR family transcriptional regulator [Devosia sp.]MCR6637352.1 LysR family transcriptional regulator [Devosia sp.]